MCPKELRAKIAKGEFTRPTAGECPGYIQMNMVALPRAYAKELKPLLVKIQKRFLCLR